MADLVEEILGNMEANAPGIEQEIEVLPFKALLRLHDIRAARLSAFFADFRHERCKWADGAKLRSTLKYGCTIDKRLALLSTAYAALAGEESATAAKVSANAAEKSADAASKKNTVSVVALVVSVVAIFVATIGVYVAWRKNEITRTQLHRAERAEVEAQAKKASLLAPVATPPKKLSEKKTSGAARDQDAKKTLDGAGTP